MDTKETISERRAVKGAVRLAAPLDPAGRVAEKFGGIRALARILGVNPTTVYRWTYSKARNGTGGRIPQAFWQQLRQAAELVGVDLTLEELLGEK